MLLSRVLVVLLLVVLAVSPFTESLANFDEFPNGGPDLELSVLLSLALVCLTCSVALWARRRVDRALDEGAGKLRRARECRRRLLTFCSGGCAVWVLSKRTSPTAVFASPLRI